MTDEISDEELERRMTAKLFGSVTVTTKAVVKRSKLQDRLPGETHIQYMARKRREAEEKRK